MWILESGLLIRVGSEFPAALKIWLIVIMVAVEQYRLVEALLQCVQEVDSNTGLAICNPKSCPVMSAGR